MKEWLALDDEDQDDQAKAEHLARYERMKDLVAGRGVLDIGCGAGYGVEEMATVASYVIGVDRRPEAIAYAKSHHAAPNVFFLAAPFQELRIDDVDALPLDVVTAFEVLEHLENPSELPAAANRFLTEDGILVLSTPYYTRTVRAPPGRSQETFDNPYHLWAWDARGLEELLRPHFADVRIGVQHRLEFACKTSGPGTSWFVRCTEPVRTKLEQLPGGRIQCLSCGTISSYHAVSEATLSRYRGLAVEEQRGWFCPSCGVYSHSVVGFS